MDGFERPFYPREPFPRLPRVALAVAQREGDERNALRGPEKRGDLGCRMIEVSAPVDHGAADQEDAGGGRHIDYSNCYI